MLSEAHLAVGRRLTTRERQALHLAKLALHRQDEEERRRSLQTLAAILEESTDHGRQAQRYDVFLSYRRADVEIVQAIARRLAAQGITPWFDLWAVPGGAAWIESLQSAIPSIETALVFLGPGGVGPWQDLEVQSLLQGMVKSSHCVIPVILPGGSIDQAPVFLRSLNALTLSPDLDVSSLVAGILAAQNW